jgi:hypothetical protein
MISGIGSSTNYFSSLFATNGTSGRSAASGLAQTEEKLFARIDTNGDGSLSQSEFTSFLDQAAAATGGAAPSTAQANALFSQMSNGGGSISLQQFESNAGDLVTALQSGVGGSSSASSTSSTSSISDLLAQLTQSAQSLVAGSAAGITASNSSNATSNTSSSNSTSHHHHHGHDGGGSLISQFMQQYQAAGATSATATSTLSATA